VFSVSGRSQLVAHPKDSRTEAVVCMGSIGTVKSTLLNCVSVCVPVDYYLVLTKLIVVNVIIGGHGKLFKRQNIVADIIH